MMTPMLVQYLVGLCCFRNNPDAVDVTVGDLVFDEAAKKFRDVDVTITLNDSDGTVRAFKAYEVKREGQPLDVTVVEQLSAKFRDMPGITHRGIVSSSSFTDGAINKAAAHDIELFVLKPWSEPISARFMDFPNVGSPEDFFRSAESKLLFWINQRMHLVAPSGPASFTYDDSTPVLASNGEVHKTFANIKELASTMYYRSTTILFSLEPALTVSRTFPTVSMPDIAGFEVGPGWPHTHTLQVKDDGIFLKLEGRLCAIESITITGSLQWRRKKIVPQFYIIESIAGDVFAGTAIAEWGGDDGRMFAFVFLPSSRTLGVHQFQLPTKHRNIIKQLEIHFSEGGDTATGAN